jgi:DNA polymerase-1
VFVDNYGASEGVLQVLKPFLEGRGSYVPRLAFHNFGFDRHVLFNEGVDVRVVGADTMHMARLDDTARALRGGYSLESLSADLVGRRKRPMKERFSLPRLLRDGSPGKERELPPIEVLHTDARFREAWVDYATYDAEATWEVRNVLERRLRERRWAGERSQWDFYQQYLAPFAVTLTDMERAGIRVDVERHLPGAEAAARSDRVAAEERFRAWAVAQCPDAQRMNVGSDAQKAHLLFAPARRERQRRPSAATSEAAKPVVEDEEDDEDCGGGRGGRASMKDEGVS